MARGIDHLVLSVRDLEKAREVYSRLGFTCTPNAQHPWGTANFLVQLQGCFLEILTVDRPELLSDPAKGEFSFGRFNESYLAKREGFSMLVLESTDAATDREDFRAKGVKTYAPFGFSREAVLPDGQFVTVSFSLTFVTDRAAPAVGYFTCQQHAPEYFWKPEYQTHANGALGVAETVLMSENPRLHREFLEKFSGSLDSVAGDERIGVATRRGTLAAMAPDAVAEAWGEAVDTGSCETPRLVAFVVSVESLKAVESRLRDNDFAFERRGGRLIVDGDGLFGVAIAFEEAR